ncbi:MAG TPA: twin-arginine translocase TatA/TatE family subunit [Bryobacteraceae bacterium]|jgi:TatA/E family protein of Tat protein translocase
MLTLGVPEMMFIFILALLLFGPKKLPELGRTVGKALAEFRRAQSELKATFDREMRNLERETESLKEATNNYYQDSYNYDHSYESSYDSENPYGSESHDSTTATDSTTESASATLGAESTTATLHLTGEAPEGTVASGSYNYDESGSYESSHHENGYESSHVALNEPSVPPSSNPSGPIHDLTPNGESGKAEPIKS